MLPAIAACCLARAHQAGQVAALVAVAAAAAPHVRCCGASSAAAQALRALAQSCDAAARGQHARELELAGASLAATGSDLMMLERGQDCALSRQARLLGPEACGKSCNCSHLQVGWSMHVDNKIGNKSSAASASAKLQGQS